MFTSDAWAMAASPAAKGVRKQHVILLTQNNIQTRSYPRQYSCRCINEPMRVLHNIRAIELVFELVVAKPHQCRFPRHSAPLLSDRVSMEFKQGFFSKLDLRLAL